PHLDGRGAPRLVRAYRLTHGGLVRHIDELALVGQVEPEVDGREERPGGLDPRGRGAPSRPLLELEGPGVTAHVENRGDAAAQVRAEEPFGSSVQLRLDRLVGVAIAKVEGVGSAVHPARL